jgi:hypothetical protein
MRRFVLALFTFAFSLGLIAPVAGAADPPPAVPSSVPAVPVATFCRSTDHLLGVMAHAPDPRKLNSARGRRALRALHQDAPVELASDTQLVVGSFTYLSRHGSHTLSKSRDTRTGDAMFRIALYGATHCKQRRIQELAQGLTQRRLAQADASKQSTTTSTSTPR